jgi:hypothetical protein
MFSHLTLVNQTYFEHFFDAMLFSFIAFKAFFYFFVHALWPDVFEFNGSREIEYLNNLLLSKRRMRG